MSGTRAFRWQSALFILSSLMVLASLWAAIGDQTATAQAGKQVELAGVNAKAFPQVSFYLRAADANGAFLEGLDSSNTKVSENGQTLPVETLEVIQPGVQTLIVLNLSDALAKKVEKQTLFERVRAAWESWLRAQPEESANEFSVGSNTGLLVIRERSAQTAADRLKSFNPDLQNSQPNMISLARALDLATENTPSPYTRRVIAYITGLPPVAANAAIENLTQRAKDQGVQVFVWLVGPPKSASTPSGELLAELAFSTGGQLFSYSGSETLPKIESYFAPLRNLYHGTYTAAARTNGIQRVKVSVELGEEQFESTVGSYALTLDAPNPIFLAPPARIERTWQTGNDSKTALMPQSATIKMLVEFKDRLPRALTRSELLVDGQVVVVNTQAPFEQFEWLLSGYEISGQHRLQVRVEDSLGFRQASIELPVEILVAPPLRPGGWITRERLVVAGALLTAALVLIGMMTTSRRKGWHPLNRGRRYNDPVSQPVRIAEAADWRAADSPSATWPLNNMTMNAPASLVRLGPAGETEPGAAVPLNRNEVTFGSNPREALCILEDSTVSGLHARLRRNADGQYVLDDCDSTAGTWVNYQEVGAEGAVLCHGDRVWFGRAAFRFELSKGDPMPAPVIKKVKEDWF